MAIVLPQGTKEYIVVDVDDELDAVNNLAPTTPQFKVLNPDPDDGDKLAWAAVTNIDLMKLYCLVDTSVGPWAAGTYRLFVRFTSAPELPVLGPCEFEVEAP
jgi:hypothetical protein